VAILGRSDQEKKEGTMHVNFRPVANATVVELTGRLNGNASAVVEEQLLPRLPLHTPIVLDMAGVPFMSSYGLRMLLLLHRQVEAAGGRMALARLAEEMRDMMAITSFLNFFHTFDTVDDALAFVTTP
jgi:anti-sigma B factor antagonist